MSARSQLRHLVGEVGRFLLVGGAATFVALVLFNVLVHGFLVGEALLPTQPIAAYVVANSLGMLISFHGSRTYAFRDRAPRGLDDGFTAYVAINLATMTIPVLCLVLSRDALGLSDPVSDNVAANLVGAWLGLAARFYLFRTFVFRGPSAAVVPTSPVVPVGLPAGSAGRSTGRSTRHRAVPPVA